ncbi:AMP-binding protein [Streptomyces sp. NPDC101733]|uniref:AMP-binding protein n=1 Tax=unclassified Streptomyces TaxID=2593676 RepID=UPI0038128E8F
MSIPVTSLWGGEAQPPCFLESLSRSAARHGARTAVVDEVREVGYDALLAWSGQIAALLHDRGVRAGDRVAVTGPRGTDVVAATLAVIRLGAACVPLDASYPERRLAHMLADSRPAVLLHSGALPAAAAGSPAPTVEIPPPAPETTPPAGAGPAPLECVPDRPVYVIYTSGSTGRPKGVALPHRCVDNMAEWQRTHSRRGDLRTAQFAPMNFDVWFQEVLGTLAGGGTLVTVPERLRSDPFDLLGWLRAQRIERLFLPCLALNMLAVAAGMEKSLDDLALAEINIAGEQLVCSAPVRELFTRLPDCVLNNHYGQSESAMVTVHTLDGPADSWPVHPPIGRPLPGCELLIAPLDETGSTDGAPRDIGELLVAGLPMSSGYLNQPELSAARYVSVERTPHGHTRAFRTGDLVRLEEGALRFVGRLDEEVKIRGSRVNLLEVEACLRELPAVGEAVCVAPERAEGGRTLHAAVTTAPGATAPEPAALTRALADLLPAAAVPLTITVLHTLPRTPSGKTDRAAIARQTGGDR